MNPIHDILVIVDPTASRHPAVDKAAWLAEKLDARLELFVCDTRAAREERLAAHMRKHAQEPLLLDMRSMLESLAAPLRTRGLEVTVATECAAPLYAALIDRTGRTTAGLVVKDTHHHSLAKRTFLTNTDWQLIRGCPVPLLLTKDRPWAATPRIVAAVDPGHANDKPVLLDHEILQHASLIAGRASAELHVLHAYLPVSIIATAMAGTPSVVIAVSPEELAREEEYHRKQVEALVADYGVGPANIHLEVGGPAEVLPRVADRLQADIVAMGAIARSGLKRAVIGSTAEDVLERLPCDALVVKPPNFADLLPI